MFDIYTQFATDASKEQQGVWQYPGLEGPNEPAFLVARSGNRRYTRLLNQLVDQHSTAMDAKTDASDDLSDEIMAQVMASTILLGWRNAGYKGALLPTYSVEAAKVPLAHKDFRAFIGKMANDVTKYKTVQEEAQAKN
jgi:hypothetical protein